MISRLFDKLDQRGLDLYVLLGINSLAHANFLRTNRIIPKYQGYRITLIYWDYTNLYGNFARELRIYEY